MVELTEVVQMWCSRTPNANQLVVEAQNLQVVTPEHDPPGKADPVKLKISYTDLSTRSQIFT